MSELFIPKRKQAEPVVSYTPNGIPKQPGFNNPSNPYDTGRPGESNRELNGGQGGKVAGWDYDNGRPMAGVELGEDGYYRLGGGGPGGGGDLTGSPYYQQVLAATNAAAAADAAARRSAIQQALIGFGLVPEGFQDKFGDVDALTRQLAEKNTTSGISTRARLLQARSDAIKQFSRGLSARGLRRSGAKGFGLRRRQLAFDQSYSDALSKLLGYTGGLYSQFAQNEYQRQLALINALNTASQNVGDYGPGGGGGDGGGGTNAFGWTGWSGVGGYRDVLDATRRTIPSFGGTSTSSGSYGGSGGGGFRAM